MDSLILSFSEFPYSEIAVSMQNSLGHNTNLVIIPLQIPFTLPCCPSLNFVLNNCKEFLLNIWSISLVISSVHYKSLPFRDCTFMNVVINNLLLTFGKSSV